MRLSILLIFALFMGWSTMTMAHNEDVIIISSKVKTPVKFTHDDVKNIFTGRIPLIKESGLPTLYILPRDHPSTKRFLWQFIGMTPTAFFDLIDTALSNGRSNFKLLSTGNEIQVIRNIALTPNSLSYVSYLFEDQIKYENISQIVIID